MLVERLRRHFSNGFPSSESSISENEMLLYIDEAVPFVMKGQMFENAKVTGFLETPDAYMTTYELPVLTRNAALSVWETTLPVPPLSLPSGYSINDLFFASEENGVGHNVFIVKQKRLSYRDYMPKPSGVHASIDGKTIRLQHWEGSSLFGLQLYARMPSTRTGGLDDVMNLPDDAISGVFNYVDKIISRRLMMPQDIIKDNLPAGNKTS
jgi:hypothetical protein